MRDSLRSVCVLATAGLFALPACGDDETIGATSNAAGGNGGNAAGGNATGGNATGGSGTGGNGTGGNGAGGSAAGGMGGGGMGNLTAATQCAAACALLDGCDFLSAVNITEPQCTQTCTTDLTDCSQQELEAAAACNADLDNDACNLSWYTCTGAIACVDNLLPAPP